MSLYVNRDYGQRNAYLERMTLRLDGFSSLNAPYAGGEMTTKPFTFEGDELEINYGELGGSEMANAFWVDSATNGDKVCWAMILEG